jgi:hypothetical protein
VVWVCCSSRAASSRNASEVEDASAGGHSAAAVTDRMQQSIAEGGTWQRASCCTDARLRCHTAAAPSSGDSFEYGISHLLLRVWLLSRGACLQTRTTRINMVDLPLGATEDRVCGTIDIEKALTEGVKAFEPGLLVRGAVC